MATAAILIFLLIYELKLACLTETLILSQEHSCQKDELYTVLNLECSRQLFFLTVFNRNFNGKFLT